MAKAPKTVAKTTERKARAKTKVDRPTPAPIPDNATDEQKKALETANAAALNKWKRDNFLKLGNARVAKVLKGIKLLGNLSNRSTYAYEDSDVTALRKALVTEVENVLSRFQPKKADKAEAVTIFGAASAE